MDLDKILSAHTGEDKKILIVLLLAYANTIIKINVKKCGNLPGNARYYESILCEYKSALLENPWGVSCFDLEAISIDPYLYLFSIKAEFIKEFGDT